LNYNLEYLYKVGQTSTNMHSIVDIAAPPPSYSQINVMHACTHAHDAHAHDAVNIATPREPIFDSHYFISIETFGKIHYKSNK